MNKIILSLALIFLASCAKGSEDFKNCLGVSVNSVEATGAFEQPGSIEYEVKRFGEIKADKGGIFRKYAAGSGGDAIVYLSTRSGRTAVYHFIFEHDYDLKNSLPVEAIEYLDQETLSDNQFLCGTYTKQRYGQRGYFGVFDWGNGRTLAIQSSDKDDVIIGFSQFKNKMLTGNR